MKTFCGKPCANLLVTCDEWDRPINKPWAVECHKCDVSSPCAESMDEAVKLHEVQMAKPTGGTGETK